MAVLAVGRQQASMGHAIGRMVADQLGYRVVDNSTIGADAARYGANIEARGTEVEEHQPSLLERLQEERLRYRTMLRCAVANLASEDNVVIIGLASPVILSEISHVVRVAVVGSEAARVGRMTQSTTGDGSPAHTPDAATRILRRSDRQRAGYLRYLFNADWLDPMTHDVVMNTDRLSAAAAASHIMLILESPEKQPTTESRARLDELATCSRIEASLMSQDEIWVGRPRAAVRGDEIHLDGEVATMEDADRATEIATAISGGRRVISQIQLLPIGILDTV